MATMASSELSGRWKTVYQAWAFCSFTGFSHNLLGIGALMICISRAVHLARNAQKFLQLLIASILAVRFPGRYAEVFETWLSAWILCKF